MEHRKVAWPKNWRDRIIVQTLRFARKGKMHPSQQRIISRTCDLLSKRLRAA